MSLALPPALFVFLLLLSHSASNALATVRARRAWERLPGTPGRESSGRRLGRGIPGAARRLASLYPGTCFAVIAGSALLLILRSLPLAITAALLVLSGRRWWERRAVHKRQRLLDEQVVELVEALIQPLKAGLSLPVALESAAEEVPEPLRGELRRAVSDLQLGTALENVLGELAERCGSRDLRLVSAALLQQKTAGGNLPQLLDTLKGVLRDRSLLQREARVLTAQGRLSGYLVASLPAVFLAIECIFSRSSVSALFASPFGWAILAVGFGLELAGLLLIRRICRPPEAT